MGGRGREREHGERPYVYVPHHLGDVVSTCASAKLLGVAANNVVPLLLLKVADGTGEQSGCNQIKQTGRNDEEDLHLGRGATPEEEEVISEKAGRAVRICGRFEEGANLLVQNVANQDTDCQSGHSGQRERRGRGREGDTRDEDDGLDAFSEHGDEGQDEEGVLFREALQPSQLAAGLDDGALESGGELDAPLLLHLADAEQGGADDGDDDGGNEGEGAFVVLLRVLPAVDADGVEGADDGGAYD